MAKTLKDLKKVLGTEKDKNVTLEQLQQAKAIYKEIAQDGFKTKNWTVTNLALAILNRAFMDFVKNNDLTEYRKTIFIQDTGYNVVLAIIKGHGESSEFDNVLSIKIKNEALVMELIDEYEFYLVTQ